MSEAEDEAGAAEANRLTQLRWHTFAELVRTSDRFFGDLPSRNWIPRVNVEHSYIARPWAPPRFRWMGVDEPVVPRPVPAGVMGIGGGPGGRYGARLRGPRRGSAGGEAETAIARARSWLAEELAPLRSGDLSEGELYAALAFLDGEFGLDERPDGLVLEPLLTRLCVAQADRHDERSEAAPDVRVRALETLALADAAYLGRDRLPSIVQALEWAAEDLASLQNDSGSWSLRLHGPRGDATTTALAWLALTSAAESGIRVGDPQAALAWLRERIDARGARVRSEEVDPQAPNSEECATPLTAFVLQLAGDPPEAADVKSLAAWFAKHPPQLELPEPLWYGTYAAFQHGGETWERWNGKARQLLLETQLRGGSWRATGRHDELATTALAVLTLQVDSRYPRSPG